MICRGVMSRSKTTSLLYLSSSFFQVTLTNEVRFQLTTSTCNEVVLCVVN